MSAGSVAQPGDLFVLLLPDEDEAVALRARQEALRGRYGGQPHAPVHLTCQRFAAPDAASIAALTGRVRLDLAGVKPCPVWAASLTAYRSPFWQTRLLRWSIAPSAEFLALLAAMRTLLDDVHLPAHYPWTRSPSSPAHVTALEGIDEREITAAELAEGLPHRLFVGRRVVLSRLLSGRSFDQIASFGLVG